jgi:steroid delta-isomerase-like uncharacterized protein
MSVEENLRKIESAVDALNAHDWDRFVELHAESVVLAGPDIPEPLKGRDALRERFRGLANAFPDIQVEKERAFGQGDWAVLEVTVTGTHKGPLPGPGGEMVPATNRPVRFKNCVVFNFEGGELTEAREYWDQLGMMAQLGLAPRGP